MIKKTDVSWILMNTNHQKPLEEFMICYDIGLQNSKYFSQEWNKQSTVGVNRLGFFLSFWIICNGCYTWILHFFLSNFLLGFGLPTVLSNHSSFQVIIVSFSWTIGQSLLQLVQPNVSCGEFTDSTNFGYLSSPYHYLPTLVIIILLFCLKSLWLYLYCGTVQLENPKVSPSGMDLLLAMANHMSNLREFLALLQNIVKMDPDYWW